jgi:hypothetical protein
VTSQEENASTIINVGLGRRRVTSELGTTNTRRRVDLKYIIWSSEVEQKLKLIKYLFHCQIVNVNDCALFFDCVCVLIII